MKITKGYVVAYEYDWYEVVFTNESDRNEMALAIHDEMLYFIWSRLMNWYGEDDMEEVKRIVEENMFIYETIIVED